MHDSRIRFLAERAGFKNGYKDPAYNAYSCEKELKAFAELIVLECADVLKKEADIKRVQPIPSSLYTYAAWNRAGKVLKEYFGIADQ